MSVGKRGKYYWMTFMVDGRRFQRSTRCVNRRDAEEVERAFRTQLAKGEVGFRKKQRVPGFRDALEEFLTFRHQEKNSAINTLRRGNTASKALLRYFQDTPIDQIEIHEVESFKKWRGEQHKQSPNRTRTVRSDRSARIKPATVNRELACLRTMINYFIRKEVLIKNPVSKVKFFKEESGRVRVVSQEEERRYLMACSQPLEDVATLMIDTGMRPSEVCKLERRHVSLDKKYVFVEQGKTASSRRKIPLSDRCLALFARRLKTVEGEFLF